MKRICLLIVLFFAGLTTLYSQEAVSVEKLRLHLHTLASDSLKGRGFGTPQGLVAAGYIAEQFRENGIEPLGKDYFQPVEYRLAVVNVSGNNVIGVIEGSDPELKNEYILIGAHYDHLGWEEGEDADIIYYGADDNASGSSAVMEIGRVLSVNRDKLGRSVIIAAFDGEESGLIGSTWFTEHSPVPVEKIKGMISLDMVGMYTKHDGVDLNGIELFAGYQALLDTLKDEYSLEVKKCNSKVENRTDTKPFGNLGIPALAVTTGMESPYHKPEDQADLIDYEGIGIVAGAIAGMVEILSNQEEVADSNINPAKSEDKVALEHFNLGLRFNVGSGKQIYAEEFYNGKGILNVNAGLYLRIRLSQILTIQPEVLIEQKGSQHPDGNFILDAVTVPCNLLITSPDKNGHGFRMFAIAGGYYSYFLQGKIGGTKVDFTSTYMDHEYGFTTGFGMEVMNVQYGMYITRGLSGIMQDPAEGKIVNRTISFMMGWTF